ncbi:MAG: glucosaminidase domain-containing protein [Prevotella sp.]|nr:glucosaminidase domain-containing protein [Prevotella sp.]
MKKIIIIMAAVLSAVIPATAQMKWNSAYQNYIDQYKDLAIEEMLRYHIPASITLAQGVFESRAGLSDLVTQGNNHFGIKCHEWTGPTQYHDDDARGECFRVYNNARESYDDHSKFLTSHPRYNRLFQLDITDYKGWARGLKDCGYATNPRYADRLINIIELYHLQEYDKAHNFDRFMARHTGNDQPTRANGLLHPIKIFNKNYYLIAREGDSFKSIGKEVGISWRKLAKYNERNKHDALHPGDIIFLRKKRKKAPKQFKHRPHVVQPGESMYDIAQKYAIRLKSLYKMNNLTPDYQIHVGDRLRVR